MKLWAMGNYEIEESKFEIPILEQKGIAIKTEGGDLLYYYPKSIVEKEIGFPVDGAYLKLTKSGFGFYITIDGETYPFAVLPSIEEFQNLISLYLTTYNKYDTLSVG